MGSPALFHHGPVGLVTIHGHLHTAAAGGDGIVTAVGVQFLQNILQHTHILQRGGCGHITAVQQDVAVCLFDALRLCLAQQRQQMADVGVDIAVGQKSDKVQRVIVFGVGNQRLPGSRLVQLAGFDGLFHQLGTLRVDLAAAQGIVANLGIAHIIVAGQTDGSAVSLQVSMRAGCKQIVQCGGLCHSDSIAAAAVALADTVHNDQNNGFFHRELPP